MLGNADLPLPQNGGEPGPARTSTIERAAQLLDWRVIAGPRQNTSGLVGIGNQRSQVGHVRAPRPRLGRTLLTRLRLMFLICLAFVLVTAAGASIFLIKRSAVEKPTAENALASQPAAQRSENPTLIRGQVMLSPPAGAEQSAPPAGPALTSTLAPAASEWGKNSPYRALPSVAPSNMPEPKVAAIPVAPTSEATSAIASFAPRKPATEPVLSAADIAALLARADWLVATGDITSARLLYERAADAGAAQAAVKLGETFDPVFLDHPHRRGTHADPDSAMFWYRRARDLGATEAVSRLKSLEAKLGGNLH
jgi:hypothetical protein